MEVSSIRQAGENVDGSFFRRAHPDAMIRRLAESLIERESRPDKVAPRVTALRETLALSKAEFCDQIGLDRSTLTKIEKGEAGLDIAVGERIAGLYGVGLDFIYRGDLSDVPQTMRQQLMANLVIARHIR